MLRGNATGTIKDVEHVIILMQENRSFDHYFGTLKGVRGFGDRFTIPLANGRMAQWPTHKNDISMGYFKESAIPFQFALANAFTLCRIGSRSTLPRAAWDERLTCSRAFCPLDLRA